MRHSISIAKTAHYHVILPRNKPTSILLAIHGYAQLAEEFLEQFKPLNEHGIIVIAPEGLSKFYGRDRKPVASWMTSHERENEIIDYVNFINDLTHLISKDYTELPFNILGFSQGVSTLMRWSIQTKLKIKQVHLVAGSIPPELEKLKSNYLKNSENFFYYGDSDRLMKPEIARTQIDFLNKLGLNFKYIEFQGRHEIPKDFFEEIIKLI